MENHTEELEDVLRSLGLIGSIYGLYFVIYISKKLGIDQQDNERNSNESEKDEQNSI
jgi:hypothetical protein